MKHILHGSLQAPCVPRRQGERCFICDGGLADCIVCQGAESCLPTDCPGFTMPEWRKEAITAGRMDFVKGVWVEKDVQGKPERVEIASAAPARPRRRITAEALQRISR